MASYRQPERISPVNQPLTGAPVLSVATTSPNFNRPSNAASLGREDGVTAFYGNTRQVFLSLGYKF